MLSGTSGDDSIQNGGYDKNRGVFNYGGSNVTINAGAGNDTVENYGEKVTINGGNGNDSLYSGFKDKVKIYGGIGDDTVKNNGGDYVSIDGGTGSDYIYSGGNNVTIISGKGNDSVYVLGKDNTVVGGAGNDYVYNYGSGISNPGGVSNLTINSGTGNDTIVGYGSYATIYGGKGKDFVSLGSYAKNNIIQYASGDGNDTIFGFGSDDTLHITKGSYKTKVSGNDLIVTVGKGKITLKDAIASSINIKSASGSVKKFKFFNEIYNEKSNTLLSGTSGRDIIFNGWDDKEHNLSRYGGTNVTINASAGNDSIQNYHGTEVLIFGGDGNDSIYNYSGVDVTIYGGSGDDSIGNYSGNVTISAGKGNDTIINWGVGENVTIDGGTGNDYIKNEQSSNTKITGGYGNDYMYNFGDYVTIVGGVGSDSVDSNEQYVTISGGKGKDHISLGSYSRNNVIQYAKGDGNDIIFGFNSDDTLQITKGSYKVSTKKNDVIVKVGTGKIILKDAVGQEISIKDSKGNVTAKTYSLSTSALFAENNFVTSDNLSEIVENNLTPTTLEKIETNNFENLTQENNLITFAEK